MKFSLKSILVFIMSWVSTGLAFVRSSFPLRMLSHSGASTTAMPKLPDGLVKYSQVPKKGCFTKDTIPKGLLRRHNTKAGTWGIINVSSGLLRYEIYEPYSCVHTLDVNTKGIIEPRIWHEVAALSDDVEFVVEFWRLPGTGPVDEKREGL